MGDNVHEIWELEQMKQSIITFAAVYALVLGATSCGGTNSNPVGIAPVGTAGYVQIERLARPAIKEATENFANHDATNRVSPESAGTDSVLSQSIHDFAKFVGRDEAHATTLQAILIPDELTADLSKAGAAGYLGVETGGAAGPIKSDFGGRGLTDDVIDTDLYAVFGTALSDLRFVADDGKSSPCLTTDNVSAAQGQATDGITPATFPYVGAPH
ncbi:MAG: hypothetical protein NVS3B28_19350 [Candidatus Velthaea sp.]